MLATFLSSLQICWFTIFFLNFIASDFRIRMSFIARYVYIYEEFVFVSEATAVQQNDSDRTKKTQIIKIIKNNK